MNKPALVISAVVLSTTTATAALVAGTGSADGSEVRSRPASTAVDPAHFAHPGHNAYFPLTPGLVTRLRGRDGGEHFRERVMVTWSTRLIEGVRTRVVYDVTHRRNGTLAERTWDWYAADDEGNVWYFGENTATYDRRGHLESREGSWMAGKDGATPGIIMPADPRPTDAYRQEYYRGHAEDQAWITDRGEGLRVPAGTFHAVVRSYEWSRLEPGVLSVKLYAPGVGIVKERDVAGGSEVFRLVGVRR
jgi:hypothetical protein